MKSIIVILITICILLVITGCESTGFNKRTTLVPDRIGIQIGYPLQDSAKGVYNGIYFNAQWDLGE